MSEDTQASDVLEWVVEIVSSYVSNNSVPAGDLPGLLNSVHDSLQRISGQPKEAPPEPLTPAVAVRKSVADDHIVCLEDGKSFKSLKRHLQTVHGMTPDQYRQRWNLGRDYPMVAPAYAKARSALAKGMGLGASRRKEAVEDEAEDVTHEDVTHEDIARGDVLAMDEMPEQAAPDGTDAPDLEDTAAEAAAPAEDKKPRAPRRKAAKA